jgi:hypothetical protein
MMIANQAIGSARAEQNNGVGQRRFSNRPAALLVSALVFASLTNLAMVAWAEKGTSARLSLPPIPDLDSMPWMKWNATGPTLKIDTLMTPAINPWTFPQTAEDPAQARPASS